MTRQITITTEEGESLAYAGTDVLDSSYDWQLPVDEHNKLVDFWVSLITRCDPNIDGDKLTRDHSL